MDIESEYDEEAKKIIDLLHILRLERQNNIKNNILLESVNKLAQNLMPSLREKLNNIVYGLSLQNNSSDFKGKSLASLMGLKNVEESLNEEERICIKDLLERSLKKSHTEQILHSSKLLGKDISTAFESPEEVNMTIDKDVRLQIDMKQEFEDEQNEHAALLSTKVSRSEDLCHLRLVRMSEISERKASEFDSELRRIYTKMQLLEVTTKQAIFGETSETMKAFQIMTEDMKKLRSLYESEIAVLKMKVTKYKMLNSAEFNEILRKYIEYKKYLESKELIYRSRNTNCKNDE